MIRAPLAATLTVGVLLVGLGGCGAPPEPAPNAPAPPAAAPRLPARPAELPLDGLDACAVLTPAQLDGFGLAPVGFREDESDVLGSPACLWDTDTKRTDQSRLARLITERAAEFYLDNQNPVRVVTIAGFPAVETTSPIAASDQDHCLVLVDVAAGQTLWTQYDALLRDNPGITQQVSCARARDGAAAMVATLRELRKAAN